MQTVGNCKSLLLILQGHEFHDYDIVLGTKWLSTLGSVIWNFQLTQMRFSKGGKEILLQGLRSAFHLIDITKEIM